MNSIKFTSQLTQQPKKITSNKDSMVVTKMEMESALSHMGGAAPSAAMVGVQVTGFFGHRTFTT